jgi:hypothetical protein
MAISWTSNIGKTQISGSQSIDVYPYKSGFNTGLVTLPVALNLQGTFVILLLVMGGLLGILGSLVGRGGSVALAIGGLLSLLSAIVFGVNMIVELSRPEVLAAEVPRVALFSSGTLSGAYTRSYYAYLSFGFWLVVAGGIILLAATRKNRDRSIPDLEQQKNVQTTNSVFQYPPPPPTLASRQQDEDRGKLQDRKNEQEEQASDYNSWNIRTCICTRTIVHSFCSCRGNLQCV